MRYISIPYIVNVFYIWMQPSDNLVKLVVDAADYQQSMYIIKCLIKKAYNYL